MSKPEPEELKEVLASIDQMQVEIARDLLTEGGIECFIFDEDSSRMLGSAAAVPTRLMVHADDYQEALQALKELGFED